VAAQILKFTDNNWDATFWVSAAVYLVGAAAWWFIDPVTPLEAEAKSERSPGAPAPAGPSSS
ncbi:MAG: hypothetical protein FJ388_20805, partial [Verrucomicrobia bacterium]|nr:hypothetical protein [Verrucomicrobiota bacterium]